MIDVTKYYFSPSAMTVTPNMVTGSFTRSETIEVSVMAGAAIKVANKLVTRANRELNLGYNAQLDYRQFTFIGHNTVLGHPNDQYDEVPVCAYIRLDASNNGSTGELVFLPYEVDYDGRLLLTEGGSPVLYDSIPLETHTDQQGHTYYTLANTNDNSDSGLYYYYIHIATLSAPVNGQRGWTQNLQIGQLETSKGNDEKEDPVLDKMFRLVNNVINVLLPFDKLSFSKSTPAFVERILTTTAESIDGFATWAQDHALATTASIASYVSARLKVLDDRFFRKDKPDTDPHLATFGNIHIASGLDKGDSTTSEGNLLVDNNMLVGGDAEVKGSAEVGQTLSVGEQVVIDVDEQANERRVLSTNNAIDSMVNGKGTILTNKDRLQTTNMQLRGSLTVMDLIINQLHAMVGDYYFSEVGSIENVVNITGNSYRLYLKKETETSIITLWEGDIVWSIANNLRTHKPTDASYYVHPSWMLVNAIDQDRFFIDVTMYDDPQLGIEVGTTNFPPEDGFNLVRRGNARARLDDAYKERARVWHISTSEGMMAFLDYLYTPVVGDENYQTTVGRLPDIRVLRNWFEARNMGSPRNYVGIYTQYLFAEHFLQIDWMGRVISSKNYRGEWSLATAQSATEYYKVDKTYTEDDDGQGHERPMTAYLTDTVTHMGVEWGCNRTGTTEEPSWYSSDWIMIGGANEWDLVLHKDDSPVPRMRQQKFEMGIFFRVSFNGYDVTDKVMAQGGHSVTWARTTDDAALDNTWNTVGILQCYRDAVHTSLLLKNDPTNNRYDFGQNFRSYRHASFNATVVIPMATGENKTISKTYNFM